MKAWELARKIYINAKPVVLDEEEQTWEAMKSISSFYDSLLSIEWSSNVPGSGAPENSMIAAVQALENRGYLVKNSENLIVEGIKANEDKNFVKLNEITSLLKNELLNAKKDEKAHYWNYTIYSSYDEYIKKVTFPESIEVDVNTNEFLNKTKAAWLSQLIGAAMGTQVEGYTSENLFNTFGDVKSFVREPNTYNDDITFELAFLDAFKKRGYKITSKDIALAWIGLIPCGWSAEEIALKNIRSGILPPLSGTNNNPFNEWIGAQMRGAICGMVAPGNPKLASRLAWSDGEVSHFNNGILGEVFNAVMVSLAYIEKDIKSIINYAINSIPNDSEYFQVITYALLMCKTNDDWKNALKKCDEKYIKYNWIHAYPNICVEIIALWYGEGDFSKTLNIVTMSGLDVDCNAAQIMSVLGIQNGIDSIPKQLNHQAFNELVTYMRFYEKVVLDDLVKLTVNSIKNAKKI